MFFQRDRVCIFPESPFQWYRGPLNGPSRKSVEENDNKLLLGGAKIEPGSPSRRSLPKPPAETRLKIDSVQRYPKMKIFNVFLLNSSLAQDCPAGERFK